MNLLKPLLETYQSDLKSGDLDIAVTTRATTATQINTSAMLDLERVMKAYQTLSGEIVLSRLLETINN